MSADIRKLIDAEPFVPFTIHTADGGSLFVPTVDHIAVAPNGGRVFVFGDDDDWQFISPLLIARTSFETGAAAVSAPSN